MAADPEGNALRYIVCDYLLHLGKAEVLSQVLLNSRQSRDVITSCQWILPPGEMKRTKKTLDRLENVSTGLSLIHSVCKLKIIRFLDLLIVGCGVCRCCCAIDEDTAETPLR